MTKTFVIKSFANSIRTGFGASTDPVTGRITYDKSQRPLTATEIYEYKKLLPSLKNELYVAIKPMLYKGGFGFDSSLWKWEWRQPDAYQYELWVTITFADDTGGGKELFMKDFAATGIMKYDFEIIKQYG